MDVSLCLCLLQVRTKLEASRESTWRSSGGGGGGTVTTGTSHNLRVNKHWSDNSIILLLLFHFFKRNALPLRPRLSISILIKDRNKDHYYYYDYDFDCNAVIFFILWID